MLSLPEKIVLEKDFYKFILPDVITEYFDIISVQELGEIKTKKVHLEIFLEEKNILPPGFEPSQYESKGFSSSSRVQDFPIRGKGVYLNIKRRRWRNKQSKQQITKDLSIVSEGSKISKEFADFLKEFNRIQRRYGR